MRNELEIWRSAGIPPGFVVRSAAGSPAEGNSQRNCSFGCSATAQFAFINPCTCLVRVLLGVL